MVKALDLSSNGRVVRVGSNPTPGIFRFYTAEALTKSKISYILPMMSKGSV